MSWAKIYVKKELQSSRFGPKAVQFARYTDEPSIKNLENRWPYRHSYTYLYFVNQRALFRSEIVLFVCLFFSFPCFFQISIS